MNYSTVSKESTDVSVGKNCLKWAEIKDKKLGIKLQVALNINDFTHQKIVETIASKYDGTVDEKLIYADSILGEDRAYRNHERFDIFKGIKQSFVIRKILLAT